MDRVDLILAELAQLGEMSNWEPGEIVVHEGESADSLFIVHSGTVRALLAGEGGRIVELNTLGPGDIFGELMLGGAVRTATVQVTAKATLTRVGRQEVERAMASNPDLALQMIHRLVKLVHTLTTTVRGLASVDVYGRLVGMIDALSVDEAGQRVVPGPLSQARIAERLGASRSMVNRLLQDLVRGGYVEMSRERIVLLKKLPPRW